MEPTQQPFTQHVSPSEPVNGFNIKRYLLIAGVFVVGVFFWVWANSPMIVTVVGTGEVTSKAETATMTFTISQNSDSPQNASTAVKESSTKIKSGLNTTGIPASDIFESQTVVLPSSAVTQGATGFTASISMGIKTKQISNLDRITNSLYSNGAVVVTQPILSVGNISDLEKQAYDLAVKDAKKKAGGIALSNLKLFRKIVLIEQSTTQPTSTVTTKADTASQVKNNLSPDDGLIKISKVVSVSYKMW